MAWKPPQSHRQLRYQINAAIVLLKDLKSDVGQAIAIELLHMLAHQTEPAITGVEVVTIQQQAIHTRNASTKLTFPAC
jgi:hypothetical protein